LLGNTQLQSHMDITGLQHQVRAFLSGDKGGISEYKIWRALSTEIWLQTFSGAK
jgi:hypothetical protein